ncbi:hypothetical protein [Nitrosomonas sp.]|uniref:hypothetical protein n=1 Tax=Nitrosomonas sp. TaxID=42353 RepID=UPI00261F51FF|nr:hypothetical protein [Nitrosomonas sp.]
MVAGHNVAIGGAIGSTYTLGGADVGKKISVEVSYTDGHGTSESLTSAQTGFVANANDKSNRRGHDRRHGPRKMQF